MESERITRTTRIDPSLKAAGWDVVDASAFRTCTPRPCAVREFETSLGPADYVLTSGALPTCVVEAKKLTVGAHGVLPQAERYARAIPGTPRYQGEYGVPFLYSTNGEQVWFHDVRHASNRSRQIAAFHTPTAVNEMLERDVDVELGSLRQVPLREGIRPYQVEANTAIEQAISDRHRKML